MDKIINLLSTLGLQVVKEEIPLSTDISQVTWPAAIVSINQSEASGGFLQHQYYIRVLYPSNASYEFDNYRKASRIGLAIANNFNVVVRCSPIRNSSPLVSGAALTFTYLDDVYGCAL